MKYRYYARRARGRNVFSIPNQNQRIVTFHIAMKWICPKQQITFTLTSHSSKSKKDFVDICRIEVAVLCDPWLRVVNMQAAGYCNGPSYMSRNPNC